MTGAITQPLAPVAGTDLANKTYVDSLSGPKAFAKFIKQVPQNMTAGTETVITWPIQEHQRQMLHLQLEILQWRVQV